MTAYEAMKLNGAKRNENDLGFELINKVKF